MDGDREVYMTLIESTGGKRKRKGLGLGQGLVQEIRRMNYQIGSLRCHLQVISRSA